MSRKSHFHLISILFVIIYFAINPYKGEAMTIDELITRCQFAENAIKDISMEYEWQIIPPSTFDEQQEPFKSAGVLLEKDGFSKYKLSASHFLDSNGLPKWRYIYEQSLTLISKDGKSWDDFAKFSYDGLIYKKYTPIKSPNSCSIGGLITSQEMDNLVPLHSPIGFSIFRLECFPDNLSLSTLMKQSRDMNLIKLNDSVIKMNDFNTIRLDLLSKLNNLPWIHIYFSVNYNYVPVKYEFVNGKKISFSVDVNSLERIGNDLWFPSSGKITSPGDSHINSFQVTSMIIANQGLTEKDFDITFPAGTRVSDQIANREYIVGSENK